MQFSYKDYFKSSFIIPLIVFVIVLILLIFDILRLTKAIPIKMKPTTITILIHCVLIIGLSLFSIVPLSRSYSLVREKETDAVIKQGVVQEIEKMFVPNKYYIDGKVVWSQYIVIDNIKYYCMTADYVEIGMTVEIKYLPTSRYILEIERN